MRNILVSWIGGNDLEAAEKSSDTLGPLLSTLKAHQFSGVYLLYNYPVAKVKPYLHWLAQYVDADIIASHRALESPIHFAGIYQASLQLLQDVWQKHSADKITILLSPGTSFTSASLVAVSTLVIHFISFRQLAYSLARPDRVGFWYGAYTSSSILSVRYAGSLIVAIYTFVLAALTGSIFN